MVGLVLLLAAASQPPPSFGFLSPVDGVWQVWASVSGAAPRPITADPEDKVCLSSSPARGELLALTRGGTALLLRPGGEILETVPLGPGADEAALAPAGDRIAYSRETGPLRDRDIWVAERGEGPGRAVVRRAGMQHAPSFSPDGSALAFTATGDAGGEDVWWLRLDGSQELQLTAGPNVHLEPSVSPDGGLFVSSNRGGDYDIWRIDPAGREARRVVAGGGLDGQPRVAPDGAHLLFVSRRSGRGAVWVARTDGTGARPLTDGSMEVRSPVWLAADLQEKAAPASGGAAAMPPEGAPRGEIALLRLGEGGWQPWRVRPDGSGLRPIATIPMDATRLSASADGRTVLVNGADGSIFVIEEGGGEPRRVDLDPPGPTDAALSPDGRRIAYSVNTLGGIDSNDIWVVGVEGGRARKITDQPHLQHFPSWAPGGRILYLSGQGGQTHDVWSVASGGAPPVLILGEHHYNFEPAASAGGDIAFSSNRTGDYEIWLLEAGSKEPRRLTRDPAYDGQPSFSPDGTRIAFVSRRGGAGRVWILDARSGTATPLPVEGEARMPFWFGGRDGGDPRRGDGR